MCALPLFPSPPSLRSLTLPLILALIPCPRSSSGSGTSIQKFLSSRSAFYYKEKINLSFLPLAHHLPLSLLHALSLPPNSRDTPFNSTSHPRYTFALKWIPRLSQTSRCLSSKLSGEYVQGEAYTHTQRLADRGTRESKARGIRRHTNPTDHPTDKKNIFISNVGYCLLSIQNPVWWHKNPLSALWSIYALPNAL